MREFRQGNIHPPSHSFAKDSAVNVGYTQGYLCVNSCDYMKPRLRCNSHILVILCALAACRGFGLACMVQPV